MIRDLDVLADTSEVIHYNNPNIPLYVICSDLTYFPNKRASCHWHDDIEIMYIVEGHISYNVNGEIIDLNTNDAIVVNARQLHYGFSKDNTNCVYDCYVFKPELLFNNPFLYERYVEPVISAQNAAYSVFRADTPAHTALLALMPEIYRLMHEGHTCSELQTIALLQQFWSYWYESLKPQLEITTDTIDPNIRIQKAMVIFIQQNYQQKITIADIASAGHVSRTTCCQIFKKYYNTSPIEYLNSYRLEVSTRLLPNATVSITEIALACGFNSSSYFAETFLKVKGCTPTEYRKRTAGRGV